MGRCQISITPYRTLEDCERAETNAAEHDPSNANVATELFATPSPRPTPHSATPWGNAAAKDALAATASPRRDGNFASPNNGISAPDQDGFGRKIALTFDDGPNLETTPIVLDTLEKHGLTATFFIHGEKVSSDEARALLQRMEDAGHTIANHSEHHENLSPERARESTAATHDRISEYQDDDARFFRFPGGNASVGSIKEVEAQGYAVAGWNIDSGDWCYGEEEGGVGYCSPNTFAWVADEHRDSLSDNVLAQAEAFDGGILLMHDDRQYSANALDEVLTALTEAGFSFTTLDDESTFPELNAWAANLSP